MKLNRVWVLIKTPTYQPAVCARWTESELPYRRQTAVVPHPVKHLHGLWFKMIKHCIKWNKSRCLADKPCSMYHKPALLHSLTAACYVVWKKSAGRTGKGFSLIKQWLDIQLRSFKTTTMDSNCKEARQWRTAGDCRMNLPWAWCNLTYWTTHN